MAGDGLELRGRHRADAAAARVDVLGLLVDSAARGDVVRTKIGVEQVYLLFHPKEIREVLFAPADRFAKGPALTRARSFMGDGLLTNPGPSYREDRRRAARAFRATRMAGAVGAIAALAAETRDDWREGERPDLYQDMCLLALRIVARTILGVDLERKEAKRLWRSFPVCMRMFDRAGSPAVHLASEGFRAARGEIWAIAEKLLTRRRARGDADDDLPSAMGVHGDAAPGATSHRRLRDHVVTILHAGHEPIADMLTWTWLTLAEHPRHEARVRLEVDSVVGRGPVTWEAMPRLSYTRAVLAEILRLYPPSWAIERRALVDVQVGSHTVHAGSLILVSPYVTHRDERFFPRADEFRPERWLEGNEDTGGGAYFPFGGGARACIGESLAWVEGTAVLATLLPRWSVRPLSPVGAPRSLMTLQPPSPIPVSLRSAKDSRAVESVRT